MTRVKIPKSAHTGRNASTTKPADWCDFETAVAAYQKGGHDGIGFVFIKDSRIVGIDLDECIDAAPGERSAWAQAVIAELDSYTEVSPSGKGLHGYVFGTIPQARKKGSHPTSALEIYDNGRYFTVTGRRFTERLKVEERQEALTRGYPRAFGNGATSNPKPTIRPAPALDITDAELLDKALVASNGSKFRDLWNGSTGAYGGDDSAADLALCSLLAFWTQRDAARLDRLFRQTGLMREKWNREDYRQRTIDKAITECREGYTEGRKGNGQAADTAAGGYWEGIGPDPTISSNFSNFSNASRINSENALSPADPWLDPPPLRRELPPPELFPIDALGALLGSAAGAMMEVIQSPAAICGNSLLAGAALAVQGYADVVIDGRPFPISSYFATVADSGERKTGTDDAPLKPHTNRQRELRETYDREIEDHIITLPAWKKTREEALSRKRNRTRQAKAAARRELGPEPQGPIDAILMVEEPTYEGLVKALANGYPSMGLFSDAGGRFLGGHGMNSENQLRPCS